MAKGKTKNTKATKASTPAVEADEGASIPTVDPITAMAAAKHVRDHLADDATAARFASLPPSEFDARRVAAYPGLVDAADAAQTSYATAAAADSDAMVPLALVKQAIAVRARMVQCAEHNLDGDESAMRQITEIKKGQGHLDLVRDLLAIVALYADHVDTLRKDGNKYREGDAALATSLATQIQLALAAGQRAATRAAGRKWATAFAKLAPVHKDIIETGRWLDRNRPAAASTWPSLWTALGGSAPKKKAAAKAATDPAATSKV